MILKIAIIFKPSMLRVHEYLCMYTNEATEWFLAISNLPTMSSLLLICQTNYKFYLKNY